MTGSALPGAAAVLGSSCGLGHRSSAPDRLSVADGDAPLMAARPGTQRARLHPALLPAPAAWVHRGKGPLIVVPAAVENTDYAAVDDTAAACGPRTAGGLDATGLSSLARLPSRTLRFPAGGGICRSGVLASAPGRSRSKCPRRNWPPGGWRAVSNQVWEAW
jgi:hypothetical protein